MEPLRLALQKLQVATAAAEQQNAWCAQPKFKMAAAQQKQSPVQQAYSGRSPALGTKSVALQTSLSAPSRKHLHPGGDLIRLQPPQNPLPSSPTVVRQASTPQTPTVVRQASTPQAPTVVCRAQSPQSAASIHRTGLQTPQTPLPSTPTVVRPASTLQCSVRQAQTPQRPASIPEESRVASVQSHQVPVLRWKEDSQLWADVRGQVPEQEPPDCFTTLTWNVWFQGYPDGTMDDRYLQEVWLPRQRALLQICKESNADIMCFQEVTASAACQTGRCSFLELLLQEDWIRKEYYVSDDTGANTFRSWYGNLIVSRLPIKKFSTLALSSNMGRYCLFAHMNFLPNSEEFIIGTTHLESQGDGNPNNSGQLGQLQSVLEHASRGPVSTNILMGDFNVLDAGAMSACWTEAGWTDLNDGSSSWSMHEWRPDRVIMSNSCDYDAVNGFAEVIGKCASGVKVLGREGIVQTPSDHFGLKTIFNRKSSCAGAAGMPASPIVTCTGTAVPVSQNQPADQSFPCKQPACTMVPPMVHSMVHPRCTHGAPAKILEQPRRICEAVTPQTLPKNSSETSSGRTLAEFWAGKRKDLGPPSPKKGGGSALQGGGSNTASRAEARTRVLLELLWNANRGDLQQHSTPPKPISSTPLHST